MTLKLITAYDAAKALALSHQRVYQLIEEGILPAQRIGTEWLIRPADLALARKRNTKPGPGPQRKKRGAGKPPRPPHHQEALQRGGVPRPPSDSGTPSLVPA